MPVLSLPPAYAVGGYGFDVKVGRRQRILAWRGDHLIPLLWFTIGRDGSLYLGPYLLNAHPIKSGVVAGPEPFIDYQDGEPIDTPTPSKISVHASGKLHLGDQHAFQESYRGITSPREVASILFSHPDTFQKCERAAVRKTDFVTEFRISDKHPCWCSAPRNQQLYYLAAPPPQAEGGEHCPENHAISFSVLLRSRKISCRHSCSRTGRCAHPGMWTGHPRGGPVIRCASNIDDQKTLGTPKTARILSGYLREVFECATRCANVTRELPSS